MLKAQGGNAASSYDNQIFVPLTTVQKQLSLHRNSRNAAVVSQITVKVADKDSVDAAKTAITQLLLERHQVATADFTVESQEDLAASADEVSQTMTVLLGSIAGISLVVGGIGIMNIMLVSVTERTREIGIRKAVGARQADIMMQFLTEALTVTIIGGLIGIAGGVGDGDVHRTARASPGSATTCRPLSPGRRSGSPSSSRPPSAFSSASIRRSGRPGCGRSMHSATNRSTTMVLSFRKVVAAVAVLGVAIGLAFGVGVAYGKGNQKTVNTGLSQQQIQALLGVSGSQAAGAGSGATASGTPGARAGFAGNGLLGNNTTGQITAIDGKTLTIQTAQASVKVTLGDSAKVNTYKAGGVTDLKVGDSVIVAGAAGSDGTVAATSLSQLPSELQALGAGGGGGAGWRPEPGGHGNACALVPYASVRSESGSPIPEQKISAWAAMNVGQGELPENSQ